MDKSSIEREIEIIFKGCKVPFTTSDKVKQKFVGDMLSLDRLLGYGLGLKSTLLLIF